MALDPGARAESDAGFSLMELLLVCALTITVSAIAAGFFRNARASVAGNANIRRVEALLKLARETAINERRAVVVTFAAPNQVTLTRLNLPNGATLVGSGYLENNMSFMLFAGLPDTPDAFGRTAAVDFGPATQIMFTADGTLTDQAGTSVNGTVFLGQPGSPMTARALTVFGPTATLRFVPVERFELEPLRWTSDARPNR